MRAALLLAFALVACSSSPEPFPILLDAGELLDAFAVPDASSPPDSSIAEDASTAPDASTVEPEPDASTAPDATLDSADEPDANPPDAPVPDRAPDAAPPEPDASLPPDASPPPCLPDSREPNDDVRRASFVGTFTADSQSMNIEGTLDDPLDVDWYRFDVNRASGRASTRLSGYVPGHWVRVEYLCTGSGLVDCPGVCGPSGPDPCRSSTVCGAQALGTAEVRATCSSPDAPAQARVSVQRGTPGGCLYGIFVRVSP